MDPYLLRALASIDESTRSLTPEQVAQPVPGKWSIAQILEHLTLAYRGSTKAVERILASGERRPASPGVRSWLARTAVVEFGYFPRVESPDSARPQGHLEAGTLQQAVREALRALDQSLLRAAERFGEREPLFDHPYLGGMSAQQWRKFHWHHTAHHMRQVRERARPRP